jgi:tRNA U34 5-methylaminomethyl-2-thiouridine-forming methyltransferase MnmC
MSTEAYRIVKLPNGAHSVHSLAHHETFHPVVGPVAEAEALYVQQLKIRERFEQSAKAGEEFVVWDVGLGAAANVITLFRALSESQGKLRVLSFDNTPDPLAFALANSSTLGYLQGFEEPTQRLLDHSQTNFCHGGTNINWEFHLADFPALIRSPQANAFPKPHAIMFDAFSPARNPTMWSQPVFADVFRLLDPKRPCALPTYSRSTLLRTTLLLAGFYVGVGHPTGQKEETTIAANSLDLLAEPLDQRWLLRAKRSHSAEPLWEPVYRQAPLQPETWERLQAHPQFS